MQLTRRELIDIQFALRYTAEHSESKTQSASDHELADEIENKLTHPHSTRFFLLSEDDIANERNS